MCGYVTAEYMGTGNNGDESYLTSLCLRVNILYSSKNDPSHFSVEYYPEICIHCGVAGTKLNLGNFLEYYPKCFDCREKPYVIWCKRKVLVESSIT